MKKSRKRFSFKSRAIDENMFLVSFVERGKRVLSPRLNLSGASFEVGQRVLEVKRSAADILMFEEQSIPL